MSRFWLFVTIVIAVIVALLIWLLATDPAFAASPPRLCGPFHWLGYCYGPPIGGQG